MERRGLAIVLRLIAAVLIGRVLYLQFTSPRLIWFVLAQICSALAVGAVSVRWSHPKWRSHAMIAALCLAGMAFAFAQRGEALYGAHHD